VPLFEMPAGESVARDRAPLALAVPPMVGLVLAAFAAAMLGVAHAVLRPRFPPRSANQSDDDYWSTNETRVSAIILWALAEGAGLLAGVGYFLTGRVPAVAVGAAAVVVLMSLRPVRLATMDG
jgi:hypothetical protein